LSEEAVIVVCPNPNCQREIEESILLTIRSVTPPKKYEACPYCFTKLEPKPQTEQEKASEPLIKREELNTEAESSQSGSSVFVKAKGTRPSFFQKVKALIPSSDGNGKEKINKPKEPKAKPATKKEEEKTGKKQLETEAIAKEKPREETKLKLSATKESKSSGCPKHFGYLANRPPDIPVPPQCLVCPKMVDCMLSPRES
jgi:hypothetical protein